METCLNWFEWEWGWRSVGEWLVGWGGAVMFRREPREVPERRVRSVFPSGRAPAWIKCHRPQALSLSFSSPREELSSSSSSCVRCFSSVKKRLPWGPVRIGLSLDLSSVSKSLHRISDVSCSPSTLPSLARDLGKKSFHARDGSEMHVILNSAPHDQPGGVREDPFLITRVQPFLLPHRSFKSALFQYRPMKWY